MGSLGVVGVVVVMWGKQEGVKFGEGRSSICVHYFDYGDGFMNAFHLSNGSLKYV